MATAVGRRLCPVKFIGERVRLQTRRTRLSFACFARRFGEKAELWLAPVSSSFLSPSFSSESPCLWGFTKGDSSNKALYWSSESRLMHFHRTTSSKGERPSIINTTGPRRRVRGGKSYKIIENRGNDDDTADIFWSALFFLEWCIVLIAPSDANLP